MLRRGGAGRAERAVSDGDVRSMGAMGWIMAMLAATMVALAEVETRLYELGVDLRAW